MGKVSVKIGGQNYTIAGERKDTEIREIAAHVDEEMREIAKVFPGNNLSKVAVLAAVNLSEECLVLRKEKESLAAERDKALSDVTYYKGLWEKAKKTRDEGKEDVQALQEKLKSKEEQIAHWKDKTSVCENRFFDSKMENIKLKNELDQLKQKDNERL